MTEVQRYRAKAHLISKKNTQAQSPALEDANSGHNALSLMFKRPLVAPVGEVGVQSVVLSCRLTERPQMRKYRYLSKL